MDYFTLLKEYRFAKEQIEGASVQKVHQGDKGVSIRLRSAPFRFLNFVVHPDASCFFLSDEPLFTGTGHLSSVMESHVKNARIRSFKAFKGERVFIVELLHRDFVGRERIFSIVYEVLGRQSNIIFCENQKIITCWYKREGDFEKRSVMPGRLYMMPDRAEGVYFGDVDRDLFMSVVAQEGIKGFLKKVFPVPRFLMKEVMERCGEPSTAEELLCAWQRFWELREELYSEKLWISPDGLRALPFRRDGMDELTINEALQKHVVAFFEHKGLEEKRRRLLSVVDGRLKALRRLSEKLEQELKETDGYERFRLWGETLLVHMKRVPEGVEEVELENPYAPSERLRIPVGHKRPSQAAQEFFAKYSRLKSKREHLERRVEEVEAERRFLEEVRWQLEEASILSELEQVEELLRDTGYIKEEKTRRKKEVYRPKYYVYDLGGAQVFVGGNSRANEYVTFKLAGRDDIWLHVRGYPGAHVIVKGNAVDDEVIEKAASIAAYYSKARNSRKVDVDYTKVKYVRKAKPYRPGMVFYTNYSTLTVEPKIPEEVEHVEEG